MGDLYTRFFLNPVAAGPNVLQCSPLFSRVLQCATEVFDTVENAPAPLRPAPELFTAPVESVHRPDVAKKCSGEHYSRMKASTPKNPPRAAEEIGSDSLAACAALMFLAQQFPHRQFDTTELSILSGLGRTVISQIKNADDSPFSCSKCSLPRLDQWLAAHPGFKQL